MQERGVRVATSESDLEDALAVRRTVFIEGQGVPEERELDGNDDEAIHFLATADGDVIGTARLRERDAGTGKVERVAVLERRRDEGWGERIVAAVEESARERGLSTLTLHAQTAVEGFYDELGYRTVSDTFEDAGIPHVEMSKEL